MDANASHKGRPRNHLKRVIIGLLSLTVRSYTGQLVRNKAAGDDVLGKNAVPLDELSEWSINAEHCGNEFRFVNKTHWTDKVRVMRVRQRKGGLAAMQ